MVNLVHNIHESSLLLICVQEYSIVLVGAQISKDHCDMAIWLDFKELTSYLKMPRSTLYRLVQNKQLPGHKVGRSWRFDREEIDRWIKGDGRIQIRGAK